MDLKKYVRQNLVRFLLGASQVLLALPQSANPDSLEQKVQLIFPIDGTIVTSAFDTNPLQQGLQIPVIGTIPAGRKILINNYPPELITLNPGEKKQLSNYLELVGESGSAEMRIGKHIQHINTQENQLFVYQLTASSPSIELEILVQEADGPFLSTPSFYYDARQEKTYAVTIDDAADALAEVTATRPASLFNHPTFKFLKEMHEKYNAVFSLYLFYEGTLYKDFNLSKMPSQYQKEWGENAPWLKLGFHARRMNPPYPYATASYQTAREDFLTVKNQVMHFAGEESWDEIMCSHYWSGSLESCRAWQDLGIKGLYAAHRGRQSYYLPRAINQMLSFLDSFYDAEEGIYFIQNDIWLERDFPTTSNLQERVHEEMDQLSEKNPLGMHNIHIFTHESFLLPQNHFHKIPEKMEAALSWLAKKNYAAEFDEKNPFLELLPPPAPSRLRKEKQGENEHITWTHRNKGKTLYVVSRKNIRQASNPWISTGETEQKHWQLLPEERQDFFAYRITAIQENGKKSQSPPFVPRPSPSSEELALIIYPNPFNQKTVIHYSIPYSERVSMRIYNLLGQTIQQFPTRQQAPGQYQQEFSAGGLASGVYIVQLQVGKQRAVKKMLLVK